MKRTTHNKGFVLPGVLMLLLIGILVSGSFIFTSRQSHPAVVRWARYDQTLLAAQTAAEKVKDSLYEGFKLYHWQSRSWSDLDWVVANASSFGTNGTLTDLLGTGTRYVYSNAVITATVASGGVVSSYTNERVVFVTNTVTAVFDGISRTIEEVVRYTLNRSSVFDHSYFINNHGWFYGVNCVVNGDIRSNYDIDLDSSSLVLNGHSYACGINNISRMYQTWSWSTYSGDSRSELFRPSYYTNPSKKKGFLFEFGYKDSGTHNYCDALEMPYIDNLGDYKTFAEVNNGTVTTGGVVAINAVHSGAGPSGFTNASDAGCIVLVGTAAKPIVINGPVVVNRDVVIKGYYTGQGTIYSGRNIHIIGDLTAVNPAQWEQPDTAANFTNNTLPDNLEADFLGLCAKGSIILGDYRDFTSGQLYYMSDDFVEAYAVTAADADIGYVSYTENGVSYFDGNYTNTFGTKCGTVATNGVPRKYYESSLSDNVFGSLNPQEYIGRIDAMIYNNHLTTGKLTENAMFNGGIICRDEALIASGRFYINWDPRVALQDEFRPYLPPELGPAETIQWREVP